MCLFSVLGSGSLLDTIVRPSTGLASLFSVLGSGPSNQDRHVCPCTGLASLFSVLGSGSRKQHSPKERSRRGRCSLQVPATDRLGTEALERISRALPGALDLLLCRRSQHSSQEQSRSQNHSSHQHAAHRPETKGPERISRTLSGALDLLLHQRCQPKVQSQSHTQNQKAAHSSHSQHLHPCSQPLHQPRRGTAHLKFLQP